MIDAGSIHVVLDVLRPERDTFLALLQSLDGDAWKLPTECPAYTVKGVATHVLGDDLSLLSRQRDRAENGLLAVAAELPGADFRTILDSFNDRWVAAAGFLSTDLLVELLRLTGEWTAAYYDEVDPSAPGEPVGFFGSPGEPSPFWQAIAREFVERWVHHSQVRRAVGLGRWRMPGSCGPGSRSSRPQAAWSRASRMATAPGTSDRSCSGVRNRRPTSSLAPIGPMP